MTASWDSSGVEKIIKMFAGLYTISNFGLNMSMTYTDADFSWPDQSDDWTSRSGNVVTVVRTPLCATEGVITSITGEIGNTSGGFTTDDNIMTKTGLTTSISVGDTAQPKMSVEFKR